MCQTLICPPPLERLIQKACSLTRLEVSYYKNCIYKTFLLKTTLAAIFAGLQVFLKDAHTVI